MEKIKRKYIGDRAFYKMVLTIAIPIMIQNGFTNIINMLDNLMVGRIGTDEMSGVAIVNQLIFVFIISLFGALSGAGIFLAQYYGSEDNEGIKNVFKIKIIISAILFIIGTAVLYIFRIPLIQMFLHDGSVTGNIEATLGYADSYMKVAIFELLPFTICQVYASSLRETGETVIPMKAGIAAVVVNLVLNYILIFGKFGAPKMGVQGAALATVVSRIVECIIVIAWINVHKEKYSYFTHIFNKSKIPGALVKNVIIKGSPLLINEFLWSLSVAVLALCYSKRGLAAVAGINICNTINNVFNIGFLALGSAIAIILGQMLGAGKTEEAKDNARKLIVFSVMFCLVLAIIMAALSPVFPLLYKTTAEVRTLATKFILIMAFLMPFCAFTNASYFTLRSGGKTIITFLFDSVYAWGICVTTAYILSEYTNMSVVWLYLFCQGLEIIKCIVGYILVKKGIWIHNLVSEKEMKA